MYRVSNAVTHQSQAQDDVKPRIGAGIDYNVSRNFSFCSLLYPQHLRQHLEHIRHSNICKISELCIVMLQVVLCSLV